MFNYPHICIVTSGNISENGIGGEGRYSVLLYSWLRSKNINCTLFSGKSMRIKNFVNEAAPRIRIPKKNESAKKISFAPYPLFMMQRMIASIILFIKIYHLHLKSPISLIHAQDTGYTGFAAIAVGKLLRIPVIVSSHGIRHKTILHSLKSKIKGIIIRFERNLDEITVKNADEVLADNETIKTHFENLVKRNIKIMPIPIQLDKFEFSLSDRIRLRDELVCKECKILGFIGRFAPEKNLFALLRAFSKVLQDGHQAKLVLVGAGPLESEMKNYVNKTDMSHNVIFLGLRNDVNKILSSFDIFILPSFTEGMSVALLEAMANGRAMICSNIPTISEIVCDRKEGVLIDPHDPIQIQNVIVELFENDSLRTELGSNAKIKAMHFDINIVFPQLVHIYEKLLGRRLA